MTRPTVMLLDGDKAFCRRARTRLTRRGYRVICAHNGLDGLSQCACHRVDVVILGMDLPGTSVEKLCPSLLKCEASIQILVLSDGDHLEQAAKALRAGAQHHMMRPDNLDELEEVIGRALRATQLEQMTQLESYRADQLKQQATLVGDSPMLQDVRRVVDLAASVNAPVLITGETGTGKNVVANAIHHRSRNNNAPFVSINCAALPENLIEAELFGYEKGAFTGAVAAKRGIFEMAQGGTLFLDEIGEMPRHLQGKLLSAIDEKQIKRLGGESSFPVRVRIIAATCLDLETIDDHRFRRDLYFRLSVIRVHLPPLRQRREDIPALCEHLLAGLVSGRQVKLSQEELSRVKAYHWPGNVRELRNILERAAIIQPDQQFKPSQLLLPAFADNPPSSLSNSVEDLLPLKEIEKQHITKVLTAHRHNLSQSARSLGISLSTLKRKIKSYGIPRKPGSK